MAVVPGVVGERGGAEGDAGALEWSVFPVAEYPWRTAVALFFVAASGVIVGFAAGHWAFGVLAAVVLTASLYNHFLPSRYRLDESGAEATFFFVKRRKDWGYFRSYYYDRVGLMLSTFTYASRLDSFRGMNVRFPKEGQEQVIAFVEKRLPRSEKKKPK